ncbi:ABC transporter related protein [Pseudopedobacter saltans DSM 12145]|uniref:ABC transporter related protein n=1 Tax=Pseudopedobacter saltans (strain ATCC 51119 / DSM 12145 / JCM 21818 / CCUG 39354 / LMG 10337 / NBRC 100064 / NCIMB 13643) TaxID=762903 RepID=F0S7T4_PSESL|nr:ABC transporter ATP-binding protein [Pseudopedobacter saltans]ADY53339.1 ABC transporter related protein [Pseudopedobacter saltans DSM 12145]
MKTYFRLLAFAKPIEKFAIPYVICTLFAVVFGTLNFALIIPLLNTLFDESKIIEKAVMPEFSLSFNYFKDLFFYYFDKAILEQGRLGALQFVCIVIIASNLLANFFKYFSQRIMENLRIHTLLKLRKNVFDNVMNLHVGYFSNERKGDIISKIASDVQVVQFSVTATLQVVFKEPLQLIAFIVALLMISVKLTLFSLLVIPVSGLVIARIVKSLKKQAKDSAETYGMMISYLDEALSSIKIIKAFNAIPFVIGRFDQQNEKYSAIGRSMSRRQQMSSPVSEFLGICTVSGILLYGGNLIFNQNSELAPADFIAYIAIFSQVMRPAKALTDSFSNIHSGLAAGERVLELIDTKPEVVNRSDAKEAQPFEKNISFKNVSFGYSDRKVLDNLTFEIEKGKTVALVGPSGGGKSTISDLIPRFYDVNEGAILFDGVDIRDLKMESFRSQMGIVSQESILFNDTIFNNIAFGVENVTLEQVEAAAKIANAHNFIMATEKGYETNIGDRGMKLSGGQKQRLNIARAVLRNPAILILDEATSALDTESEKLVQEAINNLMKNRTSLIIAHRLSTIQNADKILVLEAGKIVEEGSHSELTERNGLYKKLIDMQTFND